MTYEERKAQVRSYLGKPVRVEIDRPIGYIHHKEKYDLHYPINYGYIPGVLGGDGEELDVYVLGIDTPVKECTVMVIGIAHRENDVEDKLIAAPLGMTYTATEMYDAISFQEQYYKTTVEAAPEIFTGRNVTPESFANLMKVATPELFYKHKFIFKKLNTEEEDAIVIHHPPTASSLTFLGYRSGKSIDEIVSYVRENNVKKACVLAEDIQFLPSCPSLEYLEICPAYRATRFDYSPLYEMPNLKYLRCETVYGPEDKKIAPIDCSRLVNLEVLSLSGKVKTLRLDGSKKLRNVFLWEHALRRENLVDLFDCPELVNLCICQSTIKTLEGIGDLPSLKRLDLSYCSKLEDISALASCAETLTWLTIDTCNKITDYTPLAALKNLEFLTIRGSTSIQSLSFVRSMPNLKKLFFTNKVADGDISVCEGIPNVGFVDRRHYNRKSGEFPNEPQPGIFSTIAHYQNEGLL